MTKGYGFSADAIDWSSPADLLPYAKAYRQRIRQEDSQMHRMGMYVLSAVSVAIERNFAGRKAKSEYIREPLLSGMFENEGLTQEEIMEKEIRKAILAERKSMETADMKGLPKTKIR